MKKGEILLEGSDTPTNLVKETKNRSKKEVKWRQFVRNMLSGKWIDLGAGNYSKKDVIALGGISEENINLIDLTISVGFAGISYFT